MGLRISHLEQDLQQSLAVLRVDRSRAAQARKHVERALSDGNAYYGINTGFGALASQRVPADQLERLQRNLILSHAVGVGYPVPLDITTLMLRLKIHSLGLGYSGVSLPVLERLLWFDEQHLIPVVPSQGSVGASGDLAPLAHLSLPLIGEGFFWHNDRHTHFPAGQLLAERGVKPIVLQPKDGLALANGTQMMSAYGAHVLRESINLLKIADIVGAMSLEALQGSIRPFDARVHELRPHPGQIAVAANVRHLLRDSEILEAHRHCGKVQDQYSLRCIPQVHGASRDALSYATRVIETEINSVTDNPLVFSDGDIVNGGNFHGQPLAFAMDTAACALAELASISERRIYLMLEGHDGLPKLLMEDTGINSGFMIPQYTAAALVSENKILCHPAAVDSIPTSLGQEDHVSMGSISATKLWRVFLNVEHVIALELFTVAQALDYRRPLKPGRGVARAHEFVREHIPHREADGLFHNDIQRALHLLRTKTLVAIVEASGGTLQ